MLTKYLSKYENKKMKKVIVLIMLGLGILTILLITFSKPQQVSLPVQKELPYRIIVAEITAYNPLPEQTDDTPFIMASMERVFEGAVACPRDLPFDTEVEILGKRYICKDRMNIRYKNHFDIFMFSYEDAIQFGRQLLEVKIYK